jgi:hypothetical protein
MCGVILVGVLHCKVTNDKAKCDWPCDVSPKAGRVLTMYIT